jgi:hypothetical protein
LLWKRKQLFRSLLIKGLRTHPNLTVKPSLLIKELRTHPNLTVKPSRDVLLAAVTCFKARHISVETATGHGLHGWVSIPGRGKISLPQRPDWI